MSVNLPVVNVAQFTEIVSMQFQEGNRRPIFGLGKGGIGKTEAIATLARELGVGYIDVRLLMYSEVDLKGIPYPDQSHTATVWLQNNILPNPQRDGEAGILVLDEITSVSRSVRTAAYQLLNERRLGEYVLPDGWMIVCLGNGEDEGGDFQGMEGNFANRCSIFHVVPELGAWKSWAYSAGVHYLVLAYVSWRPQHLHTFDPDRESDLLFASPRSWKAVSDILNLHPFNRDDTLNNLRILSNLGSVVGNQFLAFCKYREAAVEPSDILAGKPVEDLSGQQEILFMTMQGVVTLMAQRLRADQVNGGDLSAATVEQCANGVKWMLSLPSMEHRVMALRDLAANDRMAVTRLFLDDRFLALCPQLSDFARRNAAVFRR